MCVRRGKTITWTVTGNAAPEPTLTPLTLPGTPEPAPTPLTAPPPPTTAAPVTTVATAPATTVATAPAATVPAVGQLPPPPTAQRDACLSGSWKFGPDEALPVWQTYGTAIGSLTGKLVAEPTFTGGITLLINANGTLSASGSVQMKAEAIQPVGNQKYKIQIDWTPVAAASWGIDSGFISLAGAKTALMNGLLSLDGAAIEAGKATLPRDGRANVSYRCEKEVLTLFISTFVSDSLGDKLFPYTFRRG